MAEALLGTVIQNLQSFGKDQLATFWGVDQQTQKLSSNLTAIRAVLRDAERKQITSHAVKDWLQKLTDAAYVLDDILDECSIHSTKLNFDDRHTSCLSRLHPKDILFRFNIGKRMKDITQRFHDIHEERSMFNLVPGVTEVQTIHDNWRQTSSDITEPIVYGRDQDREQILKFLLEDVSDSEELSIYPIVGMGGLGKTTLAKQVFNDNRVCKHFDLTIWVCVSDDFNTMTILQSIIECITGQNPNLNSLEAMRKKVEEVLHGSRYLLVLDDVWNEDQEKWKQLKGKLQCARAAKGATILVTTRLEEVASTMQTHPAYYLKELSGDDSWSLFKHHAFGPNREEKEELVSIGKEIVIKCVGSPLAIKTLGSLLRDESDVKQWQNVKESEIWDLQEESSSGTGEENSIMRALKLSYFNLELSLRRCFSFCAIFPKDFEIDKEELIHLWMANGFIKCEGNIEVEDVGNKVWKKLYSRSFFQEAKYDEFGMITTFKMHDLFHDLAQSIMGEECVVIVKGRLTPLPTRVHYSSLLHSGVSDDMTAFKQRLTTALKKVESLQTFLDFGGIGPVPSNHCLRALQTNSSLLSPLKDLTHLRYLSLRFSSSSEESLNNSICQLTKLQILKLCNCPELHGLPKDLTRLQDLRHIVIDGMDTIQGMPPNIGKLRHLRTLSIFVVGSKPGCGLAELHSLNLGGRLRIRGLENVPSEWDAKQANLMSKKELNRLHLSWGSSANSEGSNVSVERVLEALEPPSALKSFGMKGYQGRQLPNWMKSYVVLRDLVEVGLLDCENCEELPPLGKLPHLKRLKVSGMKNVKWIDGETYDGVEEKAFPSLKELSLYSLPNLERLLKDEGVEMLPRLSRLTIDGVFNFKVPRLPCVEKLSAKRIGEVGSFMEGVVGNLPSLKTLDIYCVKGAVVLPDQLSGLDALQQLHIDVWHDVEYFTEHVLEGLTSLRTLTIQDCKKLKSLSEGVRHLACLESLRISKCPELVALPSNMSQLSALREVSINSCCTLPDGLQRVPSLRVLYIYECTCTSLPDWLGDMTTLEKLTILYCEELRSLPSSIQRLTNLSYLRIQYCPHLKKRCKRETGEDWQYINHIPNIQVLFGRKPTFCGEFKSVLFTSPRNVSLFENFV
ncbi:putative disease resistance protein RGA4 [Vigna radiata var. radiata]|uniref:Disease resistance protein RGA4 n=1 Tax=Vigna radiata var. radiata TaxID=3916 RepID=A0A1S3VNB4_VIGRR|nr:putative disease resistance protein RGA4 [Vigna radiata var. radiata]